MNANEQVVIERTVIQIESLLNDVSKKMDDMSSQLKKFDNIKTLDNFYHAGFNVLESSYKKVKAQAERLNTLLNNYNQELESVENSNLNSIESMLIPVAFDDSKTIGGIELKVEEFKPIPTTMPIQHAYGPAPVKPEPPVPTMPPTMPIEEVELKEMKTE